jgi:hypothetical protein
MDLRFNKYSTCIEGQKNFVSDRKIIDLVPIFRSTTLRQIGGDGADFNFGLTAPLKVLPSGQIRSAWEWYHWIGLKKDINHDRFLIFLFQFCIFEKTSKFWAASYINESNLLLVRIMVCAESFLPICWCTFICWKNPPKCYIILTWIAECWKFSNILLQRTIVKFQAFLVLGSGTKSRFLADEVRYIFVWSCTEFGSLFKNSKLKLKNQKRKVVEDFLKTYPMVPTHADPIWPDGALTRIASAWWVHMGISLKER